MPSSSPVRGSWIGWAVQYQECCACSKCSAENNCTGAASTSAVPIALVPTVDSVQSTPSLNPRASALRRACCDRSVPGLIAL
jgi:hypothetical protein